MDSTGVMSAPTTKPKAKESGVHSMYLAKVLEGAIGGNSSNNNPGDDSIQRENAEANVGAGAGAMAAAKSPEGATAAVASGGAGAADLEELQGAVGGVSAQEEEYEDILGNGLLKKKILEAGKGRDTRPTLGSIVTLNVEGKLIDGTIVDKNPAFEMTLGDGDHIQAFDLGIALMEEDEKALLVTASGYAYGDLGRKPDIPPQASIMYTIKVLNVATPITYETIDPVERLEIAERKRARGNYHHGRKDYAPAVNAYLKALLALETPVIGYRPPPSVLQDSLNCRIKCYNNIAACHLKTDNFDYVLEACQQVLDAHPTNSKALYRMGKGFEGKGELEVAADYMKKALKYENSKLIHSELARITKEIKNHKVSEKKVYQKMFGGPSTSKPEAAKTKSNKTLATARSPPKTLAAPPEESKPKETEKSGWSSLWKVAAGGAVVAAVAAVGFGAYRYLNN